MRSLRRKSLLMAMTTLLLCPISAMSCGPFIAEAIFTYDYHPDFPLKRFAAGELGVLQRTYARSYLAAAYRELSDKPLSAAEQKAIVTIWHDRLTNDTTTGADTAAKAWLELRNKVAPKKITGDFSVTRTVNTNQDESYNNYLNCPQDAFTSASEVLRQKIAKHGAASPEVQDWLKAQDEVFSHCTNPAYHYETRKPDPEPAFPQPAAASADTLNKAERAYQIAAAHFYAQQFDKAQHLFEEIGKDPSSPYSKIAPYLVARCEIRKATLGKNLDREMLQAAFTRLSAIIQNPQLQSIRESARDLLDFVAFRLHPENTLADLGKRLANPESATEFSRDLTDYTMLLDQYLGEDLDAGDDKKTKPKLVPPAALSDITTWILAAQGNHEREKQAAFQKWKATQSTLWLVPALMNSNEFTKEKDDLIRAALKVPESSAGFLTARYHAVRLLIAQRKTDDARKILDDVFSTAKNKMPPSAFNRFMDRKLELAKTFDDFWHDGLRPSAGVAFDKFGMQIPEDLEKIEKSNNFLTGPVAFTDDETEILNQDVPLSLLLSLAKSESMPTPIRRDVLQALWTRSILLGDNKSASELTPLLSAAQSSLRSVLKDYANADLAEKSFLATYVMLKNPGMRPYMTPGEQRSTPFNQIDDYQDNWWCGNGSGRNPDSGSPKAKPSIKPGFLTVAQSSAAKAEYQQLLHAGPGPTYLIKQLLSYANKPGAKDARLPEALYLAIRSPKFGCTDKSTTGLSKSAFQILHKYYPNDPYSKKTKYWY